MWFSARLLYECVVHDEVDTETVFEEKLFVFQCPSRDEVAGRVGSIGTENEVNYENMNGNLVEWKVREVLEVQEVIGDAIEDGAEVYFRYWEKPDSRDYETLRMTHEDPWWHSPNKGPSSQPRRPSRASKASPARAS